MGLIQFRGMFSDFNGVVDVGKGVLELFHLDELWAGFDWSEDVLYIKVLACRQYC